MRIREVAIGIIILPLLFAADYSGKYKGALESSSGSRQNVTATIRQEGDRVTGSIGPSATPQTPLQEGRIENGQLLFEIAPFGGLRLTFLEAGETLSGAVRTRDGRPSPFDRVTLKRTGPLTLADTTPQLPNEGKFRSMRILALRGELERNHDALNEFWESVQQAGSPLVEPDPSDGRFQYANISLEGPAGTQERSGDVVASRDGEPCRFLHGQFAVHRPVVSNPTPASRLSTRLSPVPERSAGLHAAWRWTAHRGEGSSQPEWRISGVARCPPSAVLRTP